jgi:hypothetical protein
MLIPLGILASAGGIPTGDYELIESTVLTSAQASVTFSNLGDYSSTYKHLQIRATARTTSGDNYVGLMVAVNGDTGSNYAEHFLYSNVNSVTSGAATSKVRMNLGWPPGTPINASAYAGAVIDLLDAYSTTKNKTFRALGGFAGTTGGNNSFIALNSGAWFNTSSVTSLTLSLSGGNLVAGSRFSLYGIKG